MKEELYEKVVEVTWMSDGVMAVVVLVFEEDLLRLIFVGMLCKFEEILKKSSLFMS